MCPTIWVTCEFARLRVTKQRQLVLVLPLSLSCRA